VEGPENVAIEDSVVLWSRRVAQRNRYHITILLVLGRDGPPHPVMAGKLAYGVNQAVSEVNLPEGLARKNREII
jgi:hypothetical protein